MHAFLFSDIPTRCKFYCTYVRPILEYCSLIRSLYTPENIDLIENVQRSFTRRIPGLSSLSYLERLFGTTLPSLEIRWVRYDCVLLYNIRHGNLYSINNYFIYRSDVINSLINTRGHNFRLFFTHVDCNVNKCSFFIRTALIWNSLPIVM